MNGLILLLMQSLEGFIDHHQGLLAIGRERGRNQPATHRELLDRAGVYANLYAKQFFGEAGI
mgnify:CR=1 FL=1